MDAPRTHECFVFFPGGDMDLSGLFLEIATQEEFA